MDWNNKRQRGRNNGRKPQHAPRSQTFDSNGPEVRVRGNAYQVLDKYLALARDASAAGDRIAAENYYQHAEHYYRVINADLQNRQQHHQGGHPQQQHGHQGGHGPAEPRAPQPEPAPAAFDPGSAPQPITDPRPPAGQNGGNQEN